MAEIKQYLPSEALKILGNGLYEIRMVSKFTRSMYTNELDELEKRLATVADGEGNFYFTLNQLDPALHSREQSEHFQYGSLKSKELKTTSDNDVVSYRWLLIDLDPTRPSGVASSNEEKEAAHKLSQTIFKKLLATGVPQSSIVVADSGNGYHLLVRVDFPNNAENIDMVKKFLASLDFLFSTEEVKVDIKNSNPARVTKLYGTVARKGMNAVERPYRRSNLLLVPENIEICPTEVIKNISLLKPEPERSRTSGSSNKDFDANKFIDEFVEKHNIGVLRETNVGGVRRLILDSCPFNSSHGKDSMIGVADNKPFFSCLHNSCSGNHWREFRLLYEPDFEKEREEKQKQYEESRKSYQSSNANYGSRSQKVDIVDMVGKMCRDDVKERYANKTATPIDETKTWFTLKDGLEALNCNEGKEEGFPTGFGILDEKLEDGILAKGQFTIISGDNSSGKSTFVNQLALNLADMGHKSAIYSGELAIKRFTKWMFRQACGTRNMKMSKNGNLYVPDYIQTEISEWAKDKIFLYNNRNSQKVSEISKAIINCIKTNGVELVVVDNLMSMETEEVGTEYGVDKQIIKALIEISQSYNVHIILIAHPRKSNGYLRKNDISGEKNISNLADNIFIIHRVNDDFKHSYYEYKYGKKWFEGCSTGFEEYGNILEICKNRDNGKAIDQKIPFYFDAECNRFMETKNDDVRYGWERDNYMNNELIDVEDLPFG